MSVNVWLCVCLERKYADKIMSIFVEYFIMHILLIYFILLRMSHLKFIPFQLKKQTKKTCDKNNIDHLPVTKYILLLSHVCDFGTEKVYTLSDSFSVNV